MLLLASNSLLSQNSLVYGFNKLENIYNFNLTGNYRIDHESGHIDIIQNYNGTALNAANFSFRDNEEFKLFSNTNVTKSLSFITETNWMHNSNTRQLGVSDLDRKNLLLGGVYEFNQNISLMTAAGFERNEMIGVESNASIIKLNALMSNIEFQGYNFNSEIDFNQIDLNLDRIDSKFNFNANASKSFTANDQFDLALNYKRQDIDNIVSTNAIDDLINIENRLENSYFSMFSMNFAFTNTLNVESTFDISNKNVKSSRRGDDSTDILNFAELDMNELILGMDLALNFNKDNLSSMTGIRIRYNDRSHVLSSFGRINQDIFVLEQIRRTGQDFQINTTGLFSNISLILGRNDSIWTELSLNIRKKDTPSSNDDDRDELNSFIVLGYKHQFSSILSLILKSDLLLTHEVFLKASKSANNNRRTILRFSPALVIQTNYLQMRPQFEVIANYKVFDFEEFSLGLQSFSYREINFRDSLKLTFNSSNSIKLKYYLRYFERGTLFWDDFAETPTRSGTDFLGNLLYFVSHGSFEFGIGSRYALTRQVDLSKSGFSSLVNNFEAISPETQINLKFFSENIISINGWYEFRLDANGSITEVPNLYLQTSLSF